ncbi:DNA repair protein rad51c [Balamuthia mandrillaris]
MLTPGGRDITTFPFPPSLKNKIVAAGFTTVSDFDGLRPLDLATELKVSNEDALSILRTIKDNSAGVAGSPAASSSSSASTSAPSSARSTSSFSSSRCQGKTALELLNEAERQSIFTLCEDIDLMLGQGVPTSQLTEFCGVPGIGKTQMGMQLAASVQIPKEFGGPGGACVYIDTEGSFVIERLVQMADAMLRWLGTLAEENAERKQALEALSMQRILSNVHLYRVHDYIEQLALCNVLPAFLDAHPEVKLIVLDSVAFHFRHDFEDYLLRTRLLNNMAQSLTAIAEQYKVAVVLINQVTTKITASTLTGNKGQLVPALGESWGHSCTNRIILYWQDGHRHAHLLKCPSMQAKTVPFVVVTDGIRSVRTEDTISAHQASGSYSQQEEEHQQEGDVPTNNASAVSSSRKRRTPEEPFEDNDVSYGP